MSGFITRWALRRGPIISYGYCSSPHLASERFSLASARERIGWIDSIPERAVWQLLEPPFLRTGVLLSSPAWEYLTAAIVGGLGSLGVRALLREGELVVAVWLGPWAIAILLAAAGFYDTISIERYFAASLAAAVIVVAAAAGSVRGAARWCVIGGIAVLLAISLGGTSELVARGWKPPWRHVAQILAERARSGEIIVLQTGGQRIVWHSFGYYYGKRAIYDLERPGAPPRPPGTSWTAMMPITGAPQRLAVPQTATGAWVILTRPENLTKPAKAALEDLRQRFPREEELRLRLGRLLHLQR